MYGIIVLHTMDWTVAGVLISVVSLAVSIWLTIRSGGFKRPELYMQLGLLPRGWDDVALIYGLPFDSIHDVVGIAIAPCDAIAFFKGTGGITSYLKNGGTVENAQAITNHESPRTTKLYDRRSEDIFLDEVEPIGI